MLISYGMVVYSGFEHIHLLLIYFFTFILFYFLGKLILPSNKLISYDKNFSPKFLENLSYCFFFFIIGFILFHFYTIGYFPLIHSYYASDILETAKIRRDINVGLNPFVAYGSSFVIRSFIPFFLMYFFATKKNQLFLILLVFSVVYCLGLMQKSYIAFICLPVILYSFVNKDWKRFLQFSFIPIIGIISLIIITNPELRSKEIENTSSKASHSLAVGIYNRTLVVPGKVVAEWFELIPQKYPFLKGKGYHFIYPNNYIDYSKILYEELFPQYVEKGLSGSVNTASFVYEYSNFGSWGLVLSSLVLSFLFLFIERLFLNYKSYLLILNLLPIILLSSSALSSLLFSGGWVATLLLFFIFKNKLNI